VFIARYHGLERQFVVIARYHGLERQFVVIARYHGLERQFVVTFDLWLLPGTMGLKGNLSSAEIIEQLVHARHLEAIRNVVFMVCIRVLHKYCA
jgi:adenine C2-methylase RlmN of 23S rRNA A2503 and tRNA A37